MNAWCAWIGRIMNHKLLAARVPLAWIALGLVLLIALVQILVFNFSGSVELGVAEVAAGLSVNPVALLILVLLALSCRVAPVPGAAKAVVISVAVTVSLFAVAAVVQAITIVQTASDQGKWWEALTAGPLYGIVPLVLLTIVAWVLVGGTGSSSAADTAQPRPVESADFSNSGSEDVQSANQDAPGAELAPPEVPSSDDQAPTWQLDKASGVVWQSAAAAATGAQGSGYGMPGQVRGSWQPAPALQAVETESADSPTSSHSPVSAPSPVPPDSDSVDEDNPGEDSSAEEATDTDVDDESADDSELVGKEPTSDEPATSPPGRRFAAAAQLSESPSSGDPQPRTDLVVSVPQLPHWPQLQHLGLTSGNDRHVIPSK